MGTAVAFLAGPRGLTGFPRGICGSRVVLGVRGISELDTDYEVCLNGRVVESGKI